MYGAIVVTLTMLLRLINCRFVTINLLAHLLVSEPTKPPFGGDENRRRHSRLVHPPVFAQRNRAILRFLGGRRTARSFILLVCPSIVVESVALVVGVQTLSDAQLDVYRTVVVLLNLCQLSHSFSCFGAGVTNLSEPLRVFCSLPIIAG